jgi:glycosyltransferase involved in cell wall biosynthesis
MAEVEQARGAPSMDVIDKDPPLVSVVMPCLDEAAGVGICVEKARMALETMDLDFEIIVIDNGSTDGSAAIAEDAGARVVFERRRGYGAAYLRGFKEAAGELIVMGDADDTYDFSDIPRFLEPLLAGDCSFVIGSRFAGRIEPGAMPWSHRYVGNPILSGLLRLLFRTSVSDSHCGMRAFTREAIDRMRLRTTGMEFASEMVVNALRERIEIEETPIVYHPRRGESKLEGMSDAWRHIRFLLIFSPAYLFRLPGLLLTGVGAAVMLALAGGPIEYFGRVWDHHTILFGCLALVLGYNLVIFDTLAKVFSVGAGLAPEDRWISRGLQIFTLERGLFLGFGLFVFGLGLELKIVHDWIRAGAGALSAVRGVSIGMTSMVLGAQTAFASFLVSLLLLKHR